jgi:hypothetical protein
MARTAAGVCNPLDATAEPSVARASCAMVVWLPANARGRPVRDEDRILAIGLDHPAASQRAFPAEAKAGCGLLHFRQPMPNRH